MVVVCIGVCYTCIGNKGDLNKLTQMCLKMTENPTECAPWCAQCKLFGDLKDSTCYHVIK